MDLSERPFGDSFLRHPWELAKRAFLFRLVSAFGLDAAPVRILDAGAGDGWIGTELLRVMPAGSSLISWDIHYDASAAPSDHHRLTPTLGAADMGTLLLALDVLEHVDQPHEWLSALVSRHLAPGGRAVVSVPAWPFLYGRHDRALGHRCRFRPATVRRLVTYSGLEVVCEGGLFFSLLPARILANGADRLRRAKGSLPRADRLEWRGGRLTHRAVTQALAFDGRLALALARRGVPLPGLSWWALCGKR